MLYYKYASNPLFWEGHGNPLHYSCMENPMGRGVWWATVHYVSSQETTSSNWACMQSSILLKYSWFTNNNVVLISAVQQRDSIIHIYIYILFHILFHYGLSQDLEYRSLCYTVGTCLSILYITVVILALTYKSSNFNSICSLTFWINKHTLDNIHLQVSFLSFVVLLKILNNSNV